MIKITKNIIFASLIILIGLMIPFPSLCQDEEIMEDTSSKKNPVKFKTSDSPHDYNIIFFGGLGSDFTIFKGGDRRRYPGIVFNIGSELPIAWSGRLALEALFSYCRAKEKADTLFNPNPDDISNALFIYGVKFYWLDLKKIRLSISLGSWGIPGIQTAIGLELSYVIDKRFEIGIAARTPCPPISYIALSDSGHSIIITQIKYKL